jgi:hypothetical protein
MTTFAELYALTLVHTKRPELQALTESAIRVATLRAHHVDFFRRDLKAQQLIYAVNPTSMFYDFPDISATLLPRLRSIKNVYSMTQDGLHQIEQLEYRETDDLYNADGEPRRYIYTLIGETLRCFIDMPTGVVDVYYFANPVVTSAGFNSWVARDYPDDLAAWAAAVVFARTGFLDMAGQYQRDYITPFKEQLIASHLLGSVS